MKIKKTPLLFSLFLSFGTPATSPPGGSLAADMAHLTGSDLSGRKAGTEGSQKAADYIAMRFKQTGYQVTRQYFEFPQGIFSSAKGQNVIARLNNDTRPAIVLTAHYDHLGERGGKVHPGANDNASGVAALLTLAEKFRNHSFPYQLVFVATDAEETGLYGAKHFVANNPLERIVLNINLDMLAPQKNKPRLYGYTISTLVGELERLLPAQSQLGVRYTASARQLNRLTGEQRIDWKGASDHYAFAKAGIPFIYFGVGEDKHYHSAGDKFDAIEWPLYEASVDYIAGLLSRLAEAPYIAKRLPVQQDNQEEVVE